MSVLFNQLTPTLTEDLPGSVNFSIQSVDICWHSTYAKVQRFWGSLYVSAVYGKRTLNESFSTSSLSLRGADSRVGGSE